MQVREELLQIWVPARSWEPLVPTSRRQRRQTDRVRSQPDLQNNSRPATVKDSEILYRPPQNKGERKYRKPNTQKLQIWAGGYGTPGWSVLTAPPTHTHAPESLLL